MMRNEREHKKPKRNRGEERTVALRKEKEKESAKEREGEDFINGR
jgi:hypothetical protein